MHPINTPYQYTLSIHPINTPYQYTLPIPSVNTNLSPYPSNTLCAIDTPYKSILVTHPLSHPLSTHPLNPLRQSALSTHPLNPLSQPTLFPPYHSLTPPTLSPHATPPTLFPPSPGASALLPRRQHHGSTTCRGSQRRSRQSAQIPEKVVDPHGRGGQPLGQRGFHPPLTG